MSRPPELERELARVRAEYIAKLPARLAKLGARAERARGAEELAEIREVAHKLRGSSGSHGLAELSHEMERVERALEDLAHAAGPPHEVTEALTRARQLAEELVRR